MVIQREGRQGGLDGTASADSSFKPKRDYLEFVEEAEGHLEQMFRGLALLTDQHKRSGEPDPELVNQTFRSAHTLKGLAGMFGDEGISSVAHRLEDVLGALRLGKIDFDSLAAQLLDEGVAVLAELIGQVDEAEASAAESGRIAEAFAVNVETALKADAKISTEESDEFTALALPSEILDALTEYEEHRLREGLRRGRGIVLVDSSFEIMSFEEGLSALTEAIRGIGELISTLPSSSPSAVSSAGIRFSLLVASARAFEEIEAALSAFGIEIRFICEHSAETAAPARPEAGSGTEMEAAVEAVKARPAARRRETE